MRLQVLSDVHLEFGPYEPARTDADVLVLAGDVGVGLQGLRWAAQHARGRPVIYVPGNHEYYRGTHPQVRAVLRAAGEALGIHVLDRATTTIDGVRFLGCTLWTDFHALGEVMAPAAMATAREALSDYEHIRGAGGAPVIPDDTRAFHAADRAFLEDALSRPHPGATVVVTHHAPVRAALRDWPSRAPAVVTSSVNRLEHLLDGARVSTWIFGHIHLASDFRVRGTRLVCNPRGYPHRPGIGFRSELVVEV
ncbi:MAG: metallophosphoesterase [Myxococcota bacterium]